MRGAPARRGLLALWAGLLVGCAQAADPAGAPDAAPAAGPTGAVLPDAGPARLAYSWVDREGRIRLADSPEAVPQPYRDRVVVTDLSRPREERLRSDRVVVLDLRRGETGKPLNYSLVDLRRLARPAPPSEARDPGELARRLVRAGLERLGEATGLAPAARRGARIVLYSAPWCGFCQKTAAFLRERGVAFELRDLEADPGAASELARKLRSAGLPDAGIPVLDIDGRLVVGFDRTRIAALLGE